MSSSEPRLRRSRRAPVEVEAVSLPMDTNTPVFFTDESGSKGSSGHFFVIGGIKTRQPGQLLRAVRGVRDRHRFFGEFKFSNLTAASVVVYDELIRELWQSDARLMAFVIDKRTRVLFDGVPHWDAHARVTSQLIIGNLNKDEVGTLLMDECATPQGIAVADEVRRRVNERFESTNLVSAVALDSRASDGLQLADLVASAVAFERKHGHDHDSSGTPKSIVARTLAAKFGLRDFGDTPQRVGRVNILTSSPKRSGRSARNVAENPAVGDTIR